MGVIMNRLDSILLQGYKKAINDISNYIDKYKRHLTYERVMQVDVVKTMLECMYEEAEEMYLYGEFERTVLMISPAKDKNGKKIKRRFFLAIKKNEADDD